jgi:hypothetical protein
MGSNFLACLINGFVFGEVINESWVYLKRFVGTFLASQWTLVAYTLP